MKLWNRVGKLKSHSGQTIPGYKEQKNSETYFTKRDSRIQNIFQNINFGINFDMHTSLLFKN